MTDDEARALAPGVYELVYTNGDLGLARVGVSSSGAPWYLAAQWIDEVYRSTWSQVESAQVLPAQAETLERLTHFLYLMLHDGILSPAALEMLLINVTAVPVHGQAVANEHLMAYVREIVQRLVSQ